MSPLGELWIARRKRHAGPRTLWPWPYLGLLLLFLPWLYVAVQIIGERGGWLLIGVVIPFVWGPFILSLGAFLVSRIAALRITPWKAVFVLSGFIIVLAAAWNFLLTFAFLFQNYEFPHEERDGRRLAVVGSFPLIGLLALCVEWARLAAWLRKHLQEPVGAGVG
jgi:hypothetical protein